jgi:hypothetical protein
MDLQCRFLWEFDEGPWAMFTFSFTGNLPLDFTSAVATPLSHIDLVTYWDAIRHAVRRMLEEGIIRGAVLAEEIHLDSLMPVALVTPHSHVLALLDKVPTDSQLDQAKAWIRDFSGIGWDFAAELAPDNRWKDYYEKMAHWDLHLIKTKPRKPGTLMLNDPNLRIELPVSLDVKMLATQSALSCRLGYLAKTIPLGKVYLMDREILLRENPDHLEFLAQNVEEFLWAVDNLLLPRRSPAYFGACDARCNHYIGASGAHLKDPGHREETKDLLRDLAAEEDDENTLDAGTGGGGGELAQLENQPAFVGD